MDLTKDQIERYSRQIVLKEVGGIGQKKLLSSKISLIGLGALGSSAAYYLAAAGVGTLQIIDFDTVEISNLHRQILHFTEDISRKKTKSATEKLNSLNPDCNIEIINDRITPKNSKELLKGKIPFTIAGVLRFHGQIMTVVPENKTSCYRCVFGDSTEGDSSMSCSQAGVIGFVPGILGCLEANEALKYLLSIGELLTNKIMYVDLLRNSFDFIEVHRDNNCMACGDNAKDLVETLNYGSLGACNE